MAKFVPFAVSPTRFFLASDPVQCTYGSAHCALWVFVRLLFFAYCSVKFTRVAAFHSFRFFVSVVLLNKAVRFAPAVDYCANLCSIYNMTMRIFKSSFFGAFGLDSMSISS